MKNWKLIFLISMLMCWQMVAEASMNRGKVLVVLSAANAIPLQEGGSHSTGIFLGELTEPLEAILSAGYGVTFTSPQGLAPKIDEDSYRLFYWGFSKKKREHAEEVLAYLRTLGLDTPVPLDEIATDERLNEFDAVFVPGGHGPLVDLYYQNMFISDALNDSMGKILLHFHQNQKPTGLICHAPAALAAAPHVNGRWIYEGYKITAISRITEWFNEDMPGIKVIHGHVGIYPSDVLREAGARYVYQPLPMIPFVVEDRELMTGQDPFAAGLMARKFVRKLNTYTSER